VDLATPTVIVAASLARLVKPSGFVHLVRA